MYIYISNSVNINTCYNESVNYYREVFMKEEYLVQNYMRDYNKIRQAIINDGEKGSKNLYKMLLKPSPTIHKIQSPPPTQLSPLTRYIR